MRILLAISLCTIFIWSCEESREACLDLNASNFDFGAVSPCDSCCEYPKFSLPVNLKYDTLDFDFDSLYLLDLGDSLSLISFQFLLSDFQFISNDSIYKIRNKLRSGELQTIDDYYLVRSNRLSSSTIGNTDFVDDIKQLEFQLGLDATEVSQLKPYEFIDSDSNLSLVIDSLYDSARDAFNILEIQFQLDTTKYELSWSSDSGQEFSFKSVSFLLPGENWSVDLDIDIKVLFSEISGTQSPEMMSAKLLENFNDALSVK